MQDYGLFLARLRAAMGPHVASLLKRGVPVVLDFPGNTGLIDAAGVPRERHWLEVPDATCPGRLRARNAAGEHHFQVSEAGFAAFAAYFLPPTPDEGFTRVVHRG